MPDKIGSKNQTDLPSNDLKNLLGEFKFVNSATKSSLFLFKVSLILTKECAKWWNIRICACIMLRARVRIWRTTDWFLLSFSVRILHVEDITCIHVVCVVAFRNRESWTSVVVVIAPNRNRLHQTSSIRWKSLSSSVYNRLICVFKLVYLRNSK